MKCPHCQSKKTVKSGKVRLKDQRQRQNYLCRGCGKRFNERTKTAMARLRTPLEIVSAALSVRSEGLEVAMKIKGSQGNPRIEWVKIEHPFTAISPESDVNANHKEAQNAALRRKCSAYRRRQNLYAKKLPGLQRTLDAQRKRQLLQ